MSAVADIKEPSSPTVLPTAQPKQVIFEQPLNERLRTFLRLEFLFRQWLYHAEGEKTWDTRASVQTLLDIMTVLSRGDIRSEIIKSLDSCMALLQGYQQSSEVDRERLEQETQQLAQIQQALQAQDGKLGQHIAKDEFLNTIRQRSTIPGGACEFDLPIYHHWLHQPLSERQRKLTLWFSDLMPVHRALQKILWMMRETTPSESIIALKGIYQQSLPKKDGCQLIRVAMNAPFQYYPEISGSGHRFVVRFFSCDNVEAIAHTSQDDVSFSLSCCR